MRSRRKCALLRSIRRWTARFIRFPCAQGDYVTIGQEIADMADLHKVQVRAFVDEPDLGSLAPDQEVHITWGAMPNRDVDGANGADSQASGGARKSQRGRSALLGGKRQARAAAERERRSANFVRERTNVLSVSRAAVRADGTERYVYRLENGRLHRRRDFRWHCQCFKIRGSLRPLGG